MGSLELLLSLTDVEPAQFVPTTTMGGLDLSSWDRSALGESVPLSIIRDLFKPLRYFRVDKSGEWLSRRAPAVVFVGSRRVRDLRLEVAVSGVATEAVGLEDSRVMGC